MTRVIIAVVGALGLAFVWRAAQLYQGSDPLAYRMVLLIGVGMLAGLVELMLRATRTRRRRTQTPRRRTTRAAGQAGAAALGHGFKRACSRIDEG